MPTTHPTRVLSGMLAVLIALSGGLVVWQFRAKDEEPPTPPGATETPPQPSPSVDGQEARFAQARRQMVEFQLRDRDIVDPRVLDAMCRVPRHRFVAEEHWDEAYRDHPLPIGRNQTISQPYIVALMTQLAAPQAEHRALDVGTGSGYQAAVLSLLCREVYSIEIMPSLSEAAGKRLAELGYANVTVRTGDGYRGWPERAPFDVIVVAASPDHVPQALVDQLAPGGRLVIPVGVEPQQLVVLEKQADGSVCRTVAATVMFVPMTGEAQRGRED